MSETDAPNLIEELSRAYWMEMETVVNYLAHSVNLDGVQAERIKDDLGRNAKEEFEHARRLAERIHILGGVVPGSRHFVAWQELLQPLKETTELVPVVEGVIAAESDAISQYRKIINLSDKSDPATQDLAIHLLADEEEHKRRFQGYLAELRGKVVTATAEATE